MKKIALRDWHTAITNIYEVSDDYDLSILENIDSSIHSGEEMSDNEIQDLYEELDFSEMELTGENIHFIDKSSLEGSFDGYFGF